MQIISIIVIVLILIIAVFAIQFIGIYVRAMVANAKVSFLTLIAMRLRKVPPALIVDSRITAIKAGIDLNTDQLEAHYLAGGSVDHVVLALIAADKAEIPLVYDRACAIDLAVKGTGKTVLEAVRTSINPAVIDCPAVGKIDAVARDGIQVRARARVTVRTNLDRFVGGATEETIVARVGEGIVTSIGSADSYKDVLENPDRISKHVLSKGLDANTAFEILSIDIADVDVGSNINAALQTEQAEADKQVAQAKAEVRRAAAVATEHEMAARTQEMQAKVVENEAQIPLAMAEAFRNGNLGIMDYARYQNITADTDMRQTIAEDKEDGHSTKDKRSH
ncbi:MAG: flotillin-like protein FloA [Verrucomicrobiales bacterium]|nr:flotillin-like protein FloA [Verrucomicrobiales bacterium]